VVVQGIKGCTLVQVYNKSAGVVRGTEVQELCGDVGVQ